MFGYVTVNLAALDDAAKARYRSCYCGLCHTLGGRWGLSARGLLSNDMTFLGMLLGSLYEPEERAERHRCPVRPWRSQSCSVSPATCYAADMNIAFGWYKAADDAADEHSPAAACALRLLKGRYAEVERRYPEKCAVIRSCVERLSAQERAGTDDIDAAANAMGDLFGEVYAWRDDFWREPLHALGSAVGRFIYLCDAYEDRAEDEKRGRFNPLSSRAARPDYDAFVHRILTMLISEGAQAFELLPLERDADILRNILYSGVWSRWAALHAPKGTGRRARRTAR